jgi:signal transduction histidine kinase
MQQLSLVLDVIMTFALVTLYGTVVWGLIGYTKKQSDRYWALGWIIYSAGAIFGVLISTSGLVPTDIISLSLMYTGSIVFHEGSRSEVGPLLRPLYLGGFAAIVLGLLIGLTFSIHFVFVFTPLGILVAYVCIESARVVQNRDPVMKQQHIWLYGGLLLWATSWLLFPLAFWESGYEFVMMLQALGVIITGSSMLTYFIKNLTESLEGQYQVSQVMSGIVQHDIRNYLQTIQNAIELAKASSGDSQWINVADETISHASEFIDEMRGIAAGISRKESASSKLDISKTINNVWMRVKREYDLSDDQMSLEIEDDFSVETCGLFKELIWNILDNSFKHGSTHVRIWRSTKNENGAILHIADDGGGISENIKTFLNSPDALSKPVAPGFGLGLVLIRGVSQMCGIHLHVDDDISGDRVSGTIFTLGFNGAS